MHYFGPSVLQRFLATRATATPPVRFNRSPPVTLARARLPKSTKILALPGD
jgi:hypothetical protein